MLDEPAVHAADLVKTGGGGGVYESEQFDIFWHFSNFHFSGISNVDKRR